MMLRLLLIVAVLGPSLALQPLLHGLDIHLQYKYKFEARVAADVGGVGEQRGQGTGEQVAGVAMKGVISMSKVSALKMAFEFSDLEVGSHHGDVACGGLAPLPVTYSPLPILLARQLNKPYYVTTDMLRPYANEKFLIDIPSGDLLWMVNLRKSMVSNFQDYLIQVFTSMHQSQMLNFGSRGDEYFHPVTTSMMEDTIFGMCRSWFTFESATGEQIKQARGGEAMEQDMQATNHQGMKLPSGARIGTIDRSILLKVTRVIDHDQCSHGPSLVRSSLGNFSTVGHPDTSSHQGNGNSDQFQRHSSYVYYLRGSPSGFFRIENLRSEGFLSYNPFGLRTQQLQSVTNQTFTLKSVSYKPEPTLPVGSLKTYVSSHFSVLSPYTQPLRDAQDWIIYSQDPPAHGFPQPVYWEQVLLGQNNTKDNISHRKVALIELIKSSVEKFRSPTTLVADEGRRLRDQNRVGGTSAGEATAQLHSAQRLAAALPIDALHYVWDQVNDLHREVLVDVLAGSGSGPAVSLLLHFMTSESAGAAPVIPVRRHAAIILAMALNTPDPAVANQLIEYIKSIDLRGEPIVGPIVYVSGTRMLHRMCLSNSTTLPYPLYGSKQCYDSIEVHAFGDYLLKRMQNDDHQTWAERATLLQAYASLGSFQEITHFQHMALWDRNIIVRTTAVYAMTDRYLNAHFREEAMTNLWELLVNRELKAEVRQSAIVAFVSWSPELHWWDDLAKLTWKAGSEDIARFLASTIETTAADHRRDQQQSEFAASAQRLARPLTTPFSGSVNMHRSTHDDDIETGLHAHLAWLKSPQSTHVNQQYAAVSARVGTVPLSLFELATGFNHYPGQAGKIHPMQSSPTLSAGGGQHSNALIGPQMKLLLKLLHSEVFLPIDFHEFGISSHSQCPVCDLLWYNLGPCGGGGGGEALHFLQPAGVDAFLPNEMGLPILAELIAPFVAYTNTSVGGSSCRAPPGISSFNITTDTKLVSKVTSVLKVLAPWSEFALGAGVDLEKTLSIPMSVNGSIVHPYSLSVDPTQPLSNVSPIRDSSSASGGRSSSDRRSSQSSTDCSHCDQKRNLREQFELYGTSVSLSMKSTINHKHPVVFLHTVPFTVIKPLQPGNDNTQLNNLKVVRVKDAQPVKREVPIMQQSTGIATVLDYEGDRPYPYTMDNIMKILRSPSRALTLLVTPSTAYTRTALTINPDQSSNSQCSYTFFAASTDATFERNKNRQQTDRSERGTRAQRRRQQQQQQRSDPHLCNPRSPPCVSGVMLGVKAVFSPRQYYGANASHFVGPSLEQQSVHTTHLNTLAIESGATFHHPYKVVAFSNFTRPAPLTLPEMLDWVQPNFHHSINMTANVTLWGGNYNSLRVLATANVSGGVSEERRSMLTKEVPTVCMTARQDPATALAGRAVYDAITAKLTMYPTSLPQSARARVMCLKNKMLAVLYPTLVLECGSESPKPHEQEVAHQHIYNIYANRSLLDSKWSMSCVGCQPHWHIRDMESQWCLDRTVFALATQSENISHSTGPHLPRLQRMRLTPAVAPGRHARGNQFAVADQQPNAGENFPDRTNQYSNNMENANRPSEGAASESLLSGKNCSTDNARVVTFDGQRYEKRATKCYELAVANCAYNPSFYVYTSIHTPKGQEVEMANKNMPLFRYIDGNFKLNIEIAYNYLAINGLSPDHFGEPVDVLYPVTNAKVGHCRFVASEDSYSCTMFDQVTLSPTRTGGVLTLPSGDNTVCGFCGNANNNVQDDNIGAHLCQYRNMSLMAASWTLQMACPNDNDMQVQLYKVLFLQRNIDACNRANPLWDWAGDTAIPSNVISNSVPDQTQHQVTSQQQQQARRQELQEHRDQYSESNRASLERPFPEPEQKPSATNQLHHGCMFSAYKVAFHPRYRDQVFLTVNRTNFCNHDLDCFADITEQIPVTVFKWPLLAAPVFVVQAIYEGYLDQLPANLIPHTTEETFHRQPTLCSTNRH